MTRGYIARHAKTGTEPGATGLPSPAGGRGLRGLLGHLRRHRLQVPDEVGDWQRGEHAPVPQPGGSAPAPTLVRRAARLHVPDEVGDWTRRAPGTQPPPAPGLLQSQPAPSSAVPRDIRPAPTLLRVPDGVGDWTRDAANPMAGSPSQSARRPARNRRTRPLKVPDGVTDWERHKPMTTPADPVQESAERAAESHGPARRRRPRRIALPQEVIDDRGSSR